MPNSTVCSYADGFVLIFYSIIHIVKNDICDSLTAPSLSRTIALWTVFIYTIALSTEVIILGNVFCIIILNHRHILF